MSAVTGQLGDSQSAWNMQVVKAMFPRSSHRNIEMYFGRIENALDGEMNKAKISSARDRLILKLYAYATIRTENASFASRDERQSHWNTASHKPPPPAGFESVRPIHAMYEAIISQYGLTQPFAMYDHRSDLGNSAEGMGALYKGRGFIQLTGHRNYRSYAVRANAPEILKHPERAGDPDIAARILAAYVLQNSRAILRAIERGDLVKARSVVNGRNPHGVATFSKAFETGGRLIWSEPKVGSSRLN